MLGIKTNKNLNFIYCFLFLMVTVMPVLSQESSNTAFDLFFTPYPEDGTWVTMDGSNTGFFLDIQNE